MKRITYVLIGILVMLALPVSAQTTYTAIIPAGESLSSDVVLPATCYPSAIKISAAWTAADLTFQVYVADGWGNRRDEYKGEVTVQVSAATDVVDLPISQWYWVRSFRIRSGTAGTPVVQTAGRRLIVVCSAR